MPKISVVLPVYNGEKYLKESIDSVLAQTFSDFELIIVDDCSTDNSSCIVKDYAALDRRIFYLRNDTNLKLPTSLNRGFEKARGDYWTWTSCDNIYESAAFEKMLEAIEASQDVGLVYASMRIIDDKGYFQENIEAGPPEDLIFRNVVGACFLYRRSMAMQVGLYNKELFLCEDYEYWLRIALVSKIFPLNQFLYDYRQHQDTLSYKRHEKIIEKGIAVQKKYYPFFIKTRKREALFYAHLRARDIYNPLRQFYLLAILYYSPVIFLQELWGLVWRRFKK